MTLIAKLAEKAYEIDGYVDALIYGDKGAGKSVYALISAFKIYNDWDTVLKHLFFSPKEAIDFILEKHERGERVKMIILDDAGLWLGKLRWWEKEKVEFADFYDVIREVCACVVFTAPSDNIMRKIVKDIQLRLHVQIINDIKSKIRIYKRKLLPSFKEIVKTVKDETFDRWIPDEVYQKYKDMKRKATYEKLLKVKESLDKSEKGEKEEIVQNIIKEYYIIKNGKEIKFERIAVSHAVSNARYTYRLTIPRQVRKIYGDSIVDIPMIWIRLTNDVFDFPIIVPDPYYEDFINIFLEKKGGDSSSASTTS